jgi:hypothetical protein
MATLGEYASLLQLGFGVGAGLSVFRAPIDLRATQLSKAIDGEIEIVRGVDTEAARSRFARLLRLKLNLLRDVNWLETAIRPVLCLSVAGAVANWVLLVLASAYASYALSIAQEWGIIFVAAIYFVLILVALEILARMKLGEIKVELAALQESG